MAQLDRFVSERYDQFRRRLSERSMVQVLEQVPSPALRPFIKRFLVVEFLSHHPDTHLPDASAAAAFSFQGECRIDGDRWAPRAVFTGPTVLLRTGVPGVLAHANT